MATVDRDALAAEVIGAADDEELVALASAQIAVLLGQAARLWALAYPYEAADLRDERFATSANKFLSLAENASIDAAGGRG